MRYTEAELKRIQDKRAGKEIIPLEDEEYDIIVKHLNDLGFVYTHIPMETFTRYWKVKNRNKEIGVKSGFPDYVIIIPYWWVGKRHNVLLFAEIKRCKKSLSNTSTAQKEWIHNLRSCNELAEIFYGADELINYIDALRT
tara:strand:+ start:7103 stop:7522 length:420 start_codon:yes stop_codon:yes gene_type:complete